MPSHMTDEEILRLNQWLQREKKILADYFREIEAREAADAAQHPPAP